MGPQRAHHGNAKKKLKRTTREPTGAAFMLRCAELGLSREDLDDIDVGMVYDMIIEKENDGEKYPIIGEPGSLKNFFRGGGKIG